MKYELRPELINTLWRRFRMWRRPQTSTLASGDIITTAGGHRIRPGMALTFYSSSGEKGQTVKAVDTTGTTLTYRPLRRYERLWGWVKTRRPIVLYQLLRPDNGRIRSAWKALGGWVTSNRVAVNGWKWRLQKPEYGPGARDAVEIQKEMNRAHGETMKQLGVDTVPRRYEYDFSKAYFEKVSDTDWPEIIG